MVHARPIQLLWFVGAAVFILALFHSMSGGQSHDWISNTLKNPLSTSKSKAQSLTGRISLAEHAELAEKIWAKTVRQRHEMMDRDWKDEKDKMPFFPAIDHDSYYRTPYTIWDFVPASWSCPYEMERIGRMGDGGKWVCGFSLYEQLPAERPCVVYSFGVRDESSFEDELLSRTHCEIWAYDYSVVDFGKQLNASYRARAHFNQVGISGKSDPAHDPPFYSIQDLMKQNGHDYLDMLKIDIEFAEFASITSLDEYTRELGIEFPIGQIQIELHLFMANGITTGQFMKWWEALEARGVRAAWTEPNLLSTTVHIDDSMTRLAEYTLINTHDKRSVLFESLHKQ